MFAMLWPNGYERAIVFGIDDVHPESRDHGADCGGSLQDGIINSLVRLSRSYPFFKLTLFITPQWIWKPIHYRGVNYFLRKMGTKKRLLSRLLPKWREDEFKIDESKFVDWNKYMRRIVQSGNFKLGVHGLNHFPLREFEGLNLQECHDRIQKALDLFKNSGIPASKVFAPPGWYVTNELLYSLSHLDFVGIGGSWRNHEAPINRNTMSEGVGISDVPLFFPKTLNNQVVNVPRNWCPTMNTLEYAEEILQMGGLLGIHAHINAHYHGIVNETGLNQTSLANLLRLLDLIENRYLDNTWFAFFEEVAIHWRQPQTDKRALT